MLSRSFVAASLSGLIALPQVGTPVNAVSTQNLFSYIALAGTVSPSDQVSVTNQALALNELVRRAELGDGRAACYVGMEAAYPSLRGTVPNYQLAAHWYAFSSGQGDPCGTRRLGGLQMIGQGVPKNVEEGWHRFRAATYDDKQELEHSSLVKSKTEAASHPAPSASDASQSSVGGAVLLLGAIGIAAAVLSSGSDKASATKDALPNRISDNSQKSCLKYKDTWVETGHDTGHWQRDTYWAYGYDCP